MRERLSRYARHERESVYTSGICTIKCGINTHEQKDRGGKEEGMGESKTEIDNAPRWVTVGDAEGSHGGREKGGDYERAGRSW